MTHLDTLKIIEQTQGARWTALCRLADMVDWMRQMPEDALGSSADILDERLDKLVIDVVRAEMKYQRALAAT